jgi:hypothetical protein
MGVPISGNGRASEMPITLQHERGNLYRLDVRGILRKSDLSRCEELLAAEIRRIGPVRLLFLLDEFEGWEPHADWNDLTFYVTHGDSIERIAIVGPERWRSPALMFAAADLRKAPVEFFAEDAAGDAHAWLSTD